MHITPIFRKSTAGGYVAEVRKDDSAMLTRKNEATRAMGSFDLRQKRKPGNPLSNDFQQEIGQFSRHGDHGIMARWQLPQVPSRLTWMTTGYHYVSYMLHE